MKALAVVDMQLDDSIHGIPLDIMGEYLYTGLSKFYYSGTLGELYRDFSSAQSMMVAGNWTQATDTFVKVLDSSKQFKRDVLYESAAFSLSEIYLGQGHYDKVKLILEELLSEIKTLSNRNKKKISAKLNEVYAILGQYKKGEMLALESKKRSVKENDSLGIAWACKSLGDIYRLWGMQEKSISSFEEGLDIFIREQDAFGEAVIRTQLARDYTHIGKWKQAEDELDKSEAIYTRYGFKYGLANCHLFRGNIKRLSREWDGALICYEKALAMHEAMDSKREIGPIWGSIGLVYYYQGHRTEAQNYLQKSIELKTKQKYIRGAMISHMYFGDCSFYEENWDIAQASYIYARDLLKTARPIYVCAELDLKIYICKLAKKEIDINSGEYNSISKQLNNYKYYNLVAMNEYLTWHYQETLEESKSIDLIKSCLNAANKYNLFLQKFYYDKIIQTANRRFSEEYCSFIAECIKEYLI
jgi:tetratricopeptide (TPR) repeat protein